MNKMQFCKVSVSTDLKVIDGSLMHKFVVKNVNGKWLVDEVYYDFENKPDKWHVYMVC